jgi:hypothetical protein
MRIRYSSAGGRPHPRGHDKARGQTRHAQVVALAAVLLIAGCDKPKSPSQPAADAGAEARRAAEASTRATARTPEAVTFRGEQSYQQADRKQVAVCGQVNVFDDGRQTYVPFVAVVTRDETTSDPARHFRIETYVASTTTGASRAYLETVAHCYEDGGAPPRLPAGAPSVPPMPSDLRRVTEPLSAPPARPEPRTPSPAHQDAETGPAPVHPKPAPAPASTASGHIVMRQNANLHDAPHGGAVRVLSKGTSMRVFAEAPGGWLQVGGDSPSGWVHGSMVTRD